ncbi:MAG: AI-2E family transporter [Holosporales bacterium]|jgi:predicted PurR-regulated permease PerM|nr:AI-2E family transporter [Holosporales bacterium]
MSTYQLLKSLYQSEEKFRATVLLFVFACVALLIFFKIFDVILLFIFSYCLSLLLHPYVTKLQKIKIPRAIGAAIIILTVVVFIAMIFFVFSFFIYKHFTHYSKNVGESISFISNWVPETINTIATKMHIHVDINSARIKEYLLNSLGTVTELLIRYSGSLFDQAKSVISISSSIFMSSILSFYMLKDWPNLAKKMRRYIPIKITDFLDFAAPNIKMSIKKQMVGQLRVSAIMSTLYTIGLFLLSVKPYILIGVLSGLLTFIPFIGILMAFLCAIFIGFGQGIGFTPMLLLVALYFFGSSFESNFLTPKLVGNEIGLHPIWIFFAVFTGLTLCGFVGALFIMPVASFTSSFLRSLGEWLSKKSA